MSVFNPVQADPIPEKKPFLSPAPKNEIYTSDIKCFTLVHSDLMKCSTGLPDPDIPQNDFFIS